MPTPTVNEPSMLAAPGQLGVAAAILYTSPAGPAVGTRLTEMVLVNDTTTAVTATLYHVVGAGAPAVADLIANQISIPGDGYPVILQLSGITLNPGDTWQALASVAAQVSWHLYGIEMSP